MRYARNPVTLAAVIGLGVAVFALTGGRSFSQDDPIEILVDTASLHDGADAGLELSEASTDLNLILPDGNKVHLYTGK